jgi:hypothetical protein
MSATPDYVVVGPVTRDLFEGRYVPGGTVTYAGLTARALGKRVGAVTSHGPELRLEEVLPGVVSRVRPAANTTTFENVYRAGNRQQWLRAVAAPLDAALIPIDWRSAPIVHLAPLAGEFGVEIVDSVRGSQLLGLTPQGWLRSWEADGFVRRSEWRDAEMSLGKFDAVVFSEEDVGGDWALCEHYARSTPRLVITQGRSGCTLFDRGSLWQVPAFPVPEVDATGAGDVFAAAFFISLLDHGDSLAAARYANCVASFAVEAVGPRGIPSPGDVERRLGRASPAVRVVL